MIDTIDKLTAALAQFDTSKRIFMDCETTSFDDSVEAFKPCFGHRATLIILGQVGVETIAIPLRHRDESHRCIEQLDVAKQVMADFASEVKILANLNVKFDMHFTGVDGIYFPNARTEDTGVLARIVYNEHRSYRLLNLCKHYNVKQKENTEVEAWKLANKACKDYGRIPLDILIPYGIADVDAAMDLHHLLLGKLPDESIPVWDIECDLLPILFEAERDGLIIDRPWLLRKKFELLTKLLTAAQEIRRVTGLQNPSSSDQYGAYFSSLGFKSNKKTKKGNDSWNKDVLEYIASLGQEAPHKIAMILHNYGKDENAESTFCTGWQKHLTPEGKIHFNVRQAGTVSLRSSSNDPNTQNIPSWMLRAVKIEDGYVGIAWDLSQIEYRLFVHYANNAETIEKYRVNPKLDFHQIKADELGLPRSPIKRVNFGVIYGMGKAKLTSTLRNEIIQHDTQELREHLYATYYDPTAAVPVLADGEIIPQEHLVIIAENVLKDYHAQNPQIKQMQGQIKGLIYARGYVRSYYGMRFHLDVPHSYVGLNRVIQGTAATLFKKKVVELFKEVKRRQLGAKLKLQIHDAVDAVVPIEKANEYMAIAHKIVTDCPFRVPVMMDFDLALYNWANKINIDHTTDVTQEVGKLCFAK